MTTPFHDLDHFLALPRVSGLAVSRDGSRVVTTIAELNETRTEYVTAIWELDPGGRRPARRLTRGAKGESAPAFTTDGDLLFVASRPGTAAAGVRTSRRRRCGVCPPAVARPSPNCHCPVASTA